MLPASASKELALKVCTTTTWLIDTSQAVLKHNKEHGKCALLLKDFVESRPSVHEATFHPKKPTLAHTCNLTIVRRAQENQELKAILIHNKSKPMGYIKTYLSEN